MKQIVLLDGTLIETLVLNSDKVETGSEDELQFVQLPGTDVHISTGPGCTIMVNGELKVGYYTKRTNLPSGIVIE